jgi:hypothetical protein
MAYGGPVLAIVGAVIGVASGTAAIVQTVQSKKLGEAQLRRARIQAQEERTEQIRRGALDRLAQSRRAIVASQAVQAEALAQSIQQRKKMTSLVIGSSLLVLTLISLRRR